MEQNKRLNFDDVYLVGIIIRKVLTEAKTQKTHVIHVAVAVAG